MVYLVKLQKLRHCGKRLDAQYTYGHQWMQIVKGLFVKFRRKLSYTFGKQTFYTTPNNIYSTHPQIYLIQFIVCLNYYNYISVNFYFRNLLISINYFIHIYT